PGFGRKRRKSRMKQKQIGADISCGPVAAATAATSYHQFEYPGAAAMNGAIALHCTGKCSLQFGPIQTNTQAPGIPHQSVKMIDQQRRGIPIHPDGFEQTVTVSQPPVTGGQAVVVRPVELQHPGSTLEAADDQGSVGAAKPERI